MFNFLGMTRPIYKSIFVIYPTPPYTFDANTFEHPHIHVKILLYILLNAGSLKEKIGWKRNQSNFKSIQPFNILFLLQLFKDFCGLVLLKATRVQQLKSDWASQATSPGVCKVPLHPASTFTFLLLLFAFAKEQKIKANESTLCSGRFTAAVTKPASDRLRLTPACVTNTGWCVIKRENSHPSQEKKKKNQQKCCSKIGPYEHRHWSELLLSPPGRQRSRARAFSGDKLFHDLKSYINSNTVLTRVGENILDF